MSNLIAIRLILKFGGGGGDFIEKY